jgi:hypothetical protein
MILIPPVFVRHATQSIYGDTRPKYEKESNPAEVFEIAPLPGGE